MSSVCLTSIGLVFDVLGAALLFFRGFPVVINLGGADQSKEPGSLKMHPFAKIGFGLLVAVFIFQLMGTLWR